MLRQTLIFMTAALSAAGASALPAEGSSKTTLDIPPSMIWSSTPTLPTTAPPPAVSTAANDTAAKLKLVDIFSERAETKVIIQSDRPLVIGRDLYVGPEEVPVNVGAPLSQSGGLYYYSASTNGAPQLSTDDVVTFTAKKKPLAERLKMAADQSGTFSAKFRGEITAVQGDHVMIDKGTLQEVHERDVYKVYDSSGRYKGLLEVQGIGDLQSSGLLYNRWEDRHKRALSAEVGDRVVFVGQRMQFGLGILGGTSSYQPKFLAGHENVGGGGIVWNITLPNGLGLEWLLGLYHREGSNEAAIAKAGVPLLPTEYGHEVRRASFIAPIWIKKNFFYPSIVSPFTAAGVYWFQGKHVWENIKNSGQTTNSETAKKGMLMPTVGAGIEFFPTRLFRPRVDIRQFFGPDLGASGVHFKTSITIYSIGVMAAW